MRHDGRWAGREEGTLAEPGASPDLHDPPRAGGPYRSEVPRLWPRWSEAEPQQGAKGTAVTPTLRWGPALLQPLESPHLETF